MYSEKEPTYILTGNNLEEILRKVVRDEMNKLEKKLTLEPKVLTREAAAERIGVCPNTVSEYIKSGRLKNRGIGRKILVLESDLDGLKVNPRISWKKDIIEN